MRCSVEQCADAMGVDVGHMSYPRLAQSIPPYYNRLRYAQCCAAQSPVHGISAHHPALSEKTLPDVSHIPQRIKAPS